MLNLTFTMPTADDIQRTISLFGSNLMEGNIKIIATDDDGHTAELFRLKEVVEQIGEEYIRSHAFLKYNTTLNKWLLLYSMKDYHNDTERNPETVIKVEFCEIEPNTGREVYKGIDTEYYYLRENHYPREFSATWYVYDKRCAFEIVDKARPNLIFEYNGEREKVRYDDFTGVAAYSDTYNRNFNPAVNE